MNTNLKKINLTPNFQIQCSDRFFYIESIIKKVMGQDEEKDGRFPLSLREWNALKKTGLFLGSREDPGWGWRAREVFSLAKKFPHLKFRLLFRWENSYEIFAMNDKKREKNETIYFQNEKDFNKKLMTRMRDFSIFKTPSFLKCLSLKRLEELGLQLSEYQVMLDQILER